MESEKKPNRLIHEKSPYLRQHAFNPVEWFAWGDEAFTKAHKEDKPIFLSVGYSTCHWCHVMERESFEIDEIAALMNKYFVNIKVDREERPDIDKLYMTALQAMGEGGGWPMSMFLTPERKPFYGGTYFPPMNRYGRIGFPDLLQRIHEVWNNERARINESAEGLTALLREVPSRVEGEKTLDPALLDTCFDQALRSYDRKFGGFGGGPKFPRPSVFNFLLRYFYRTGDGQALQMSEQSLRAMANGGIYDHLGGGFHRYSVDGEWRVPHFEKMLYDQAQLASSIVDMFQIAKDPFYERIIRGTLGYVLREMTDRDGGFYSAEDADSPIPELPHEKGEGAFYIWSKSEVDEALGPYARIFNFYYGIEEGGNAPSDPHHEFVGKNILHIANSLAETASFFNKKEEDVASALAHSREILFGIRNKRQRPGLDDKILTAWNGLMISAFARAAQALDEPAYLHAADRAADCVLAILYNASTNTLLRRYRDGEAKFEAHLDDYAFFTQGLLDLYETSFVPQRLAVANLLMRKQIELFWDDANGGFFDTSGNDNTILARMKEQYDGAEPTGNSVAAMNLLRLAHMTGNSEWRARAERTFAGFADVLGNTPFTMPQMASAYEFSIGQVQQIVIAGHNGDEETKRMLREVRSRYLPNKIICLISGKDEIADLGEFTIPLKMIDGKATAYVCRDFACRLPTSDASIFGRLLEHESPQSKK